MEKKKDFITSDVYLSSAASILLNSFPNFLVENGRTLFVFPVSDQLYKAIKDYNSGIPINSFKFAEMIKRLRGEMLSRRGTGGPNG